MNKSAFVFLTLVVFLLIPAFKSQAATFSVNDSTTLIAAINTANSNGEADIITLTADISLVGIYNPIDGSNGLPSITSDITIIGNGFAIMRNTGALDCAGTQFRIFHVATSGNLTLNDIEIAGGCVRDGNEYGGGILNYGTTTVISSIISNHAAGQRGAGLTNAVGATMTVFDTRVEGSWSFNDGGGIRNDGTMVIIESTITNNQATNQAGGIDNDGTLTITNSTINNNRAMGASFGAANGGGIRNDASLEVTNSTISNNSANSLGGGIHHGGTGSTTTILNSIINNNTSTHRGGGIDIEALSGTVSITNTTISTNTSNDGGGIFHDSGVSTTIDFSTISNNTATSDDGIGGFSGTTLVVNNSIVANNNGDNCDTTAVVDGGGNLTDASGCVTGFGTITPVTHYDTSLANNGGPTQTHALVVVAGNPAIDQIASCGLITDQRGAPRDATCDVGAYEVAAMPTLPTVAFAAATTSIAESGGTLNIVLNVSGAVNFSGIAVVYIVDTFAGSATFVSDYNAVGVQSVSIDCSSGTCPTTVIVPLTIVNDAITESDETVNLSIVGTNGLAIIGTQSTHTTTIQNPLPIDRNQNTPAAILVFDPSISKLGFLMPGQAGVTGEQVEWIVTVSNPSGAIGNNIVVSDTLVDALRIDSVNAPGAVVNISGQTVSVTYATLNPGESVQFSIITTVLEGTTVTNTACVSAANLGAQECVTGSIVRTLPVTGER
jgi:hypothetical protein